MIKILSTCLLLILACHQLFATKDRLPAATITEIQGTVEVERSQGWEPLASLVPLFEGDKIRVSKPGKVVVMYLGGSPLLITEAISPYIINKSSKGKSKKEKAGEKLTELFNKLLGKESKKSVALVVRGDVDCSKTIQPNDSSILFPEDNIAFCWPKQQPPYSINIFKGDSRSEADCIYQQTTNETSHIVPVEIFEENSVYSWTLSSPLEEWNGIFSINSKTDTGLILSEITEILDEIPKEFLLTQAIVKSQLLIDHKLFYNANRLICETLSIFPENETLKLMLSAL